MSRVLPYLLTFLMFWLSGHAQAVYVLGEGGQPFISIGKNTAFIEDKHHELRIEDLIRGEHNWTQTKQDVFNQGYTTATWWLKFQLINSVENSQYYLEIDYPVLDFIDVYIVENGVQKATFSLGDKLPFTSRPISNRLFLVPIEIEQNSTQTIFVRLQSSSSVQAPLKIWKPSEYHSISVSSNLLHGFIMGGMTIIAIYNLLLYLALREKVYLFYVSYVASMLLFLTSLHGWTFQYLWPNSTQWNDTAILIFLNGVVLFGILFARQFLNFRENYKGLILQSNLWIAMCLSGMVFYFLIPYRISINFLVPFAAIACIWILSIGTYAIYVGQRSAVIYVISWVGLLIGGILMALSKFQILPRNVVTDHSLQLGTLLEVILLSFALAQRINNERAKRLLAQQRALEVQRKANEKLEASVAERTHQLATANQKLQELSETDELTGLKNRRYLDQYLEQELKRSIRYRHSVSVLLLDIDHFKSVNDNYGHVTGDKCIQVIADKVTCQLRSSTDFSARYGGEEFCAVLPETDLNGALEVANRILKTINCEHIVIDDFDKLVTVSIGVYSSVPNSEDTIQGYYEKADKALYEAKHLGRNRVEVYSD